MSKVTLPLARMPAVISTSVSDALHAHGLTLSLELLKEIGKNAAQCLTSLDEGLDRPGTGDLLAVGHNLRGLARTAPGEGTGEALARVGEWLVGLAMAELAETRKAAVDLLAAEGRAP